MPEDLLNLLLFFIVAVVLVSAGIEHSVPFAKRMKFNQICNDYQQIAIQNGYLTQSQVDSFTSELQAKEIEISAIDVPTVKLEWGTEFNFQVQAVYTQKETQMNFSKTEKQYELLYSHKPKACCDE